MKYENWVFGKNGALFSACAKGDLALVQDLCAAGANVNVVSPNGFTALHRAAQNGHMEIVQTLLARGAVATTRTSEGKDAESLASDAGHAHIAELLKQAAAKQA